MEHDFLLNFFPVLVLIFGIFGLSSMIGSRYYKLDSASSSLRIKSSRKTLSGQEVLILCGSVSCGIVIPLLFMISDPSVTKSLFEDLLSSPIAIICFLVMILCPIGIVIISIYRLISNLTKSLKQNFIKEIVLYRENNYIKVYSNLGVTVIPFDDIISFIINTTITDIEIVIHTVNNGVIKINTLGNIIFDSGSQKLLEAILGYKTKFKNFIFNNNL